MIIASLGTQRERYKKGLQFIWFH